jgi:rRNA maturation endonuclease Nob1
MSAGYEEAEELELRFEIPSREKTEEDEEDAEEDDDAYGCA